ncbi:MAG TPA: hypothetical protein HPP77_09990 [Candidatus Hydrogenedentes bacterium]|nr:hypothetical protein [Candidatus Hydrogenedentota bacterium]
MYVGRGNIGCCVASGLRLPVPFLAVFLFSFCVWAAAEKERPQYVFFNVAPGNEWNQDKPETFSRELIDDIVSKVGRGNETIRFGASFVFSTMKTPTGVLSESVRNLLRSSQDSGVPVLIGFDGQNWWSERPDLWNWWEPDKPGYDPANAYNVEWTNWGPEYAVKICWRNWGSQLRVAPAPNIASPEVAQEHLKALRPLAAIVAEWARALPAERAWLFGGIKVGWEAGIGYNAFYYPDGNRYLEQWPADPSHDPQTGLQADKGFPGGVAAIGFAAVATAGLADSGEITTRQIGIVIQRYLEQLARAAHAQGVPKNLIFTHQGGVCPPYRKNLPFWPAVNRYSIPGWSLYYGDPADVDMLNRTIRRHFRRQWAAAEWWWGAGTTDDWLDHFQRTLCYRNCRFVCVYNWNQNGFASDPNALAAARRLPNKCRKKTEGASFLE